MDANVLRPMRDRAALRRGFPATSELLGRLGVRRTEGAVELGSGELSPVRDSIMQR